MAAAFRAWARSNASVSASAGWSASSGIQRPSPGRIGTASCVPVAFQASSRVGVPRLRWLTSVETKGPEQRAAQTGPGCGPGSRITCARSGSIEASNGARTAPSNRTSPATTRAGAADAATLESSAAALSPRRPSVAVTAAPCGPATTPTSETPNSRSVKTARATSGNPPTTASAPGPVATTTARVTPLAVSVMRGPR